MASQTSTLVSRCTHLVRIEVNAVSFCLSIVLMVCMCFTCFLEVNAYTTG